MRKRISRKNERLRRMHPGEEEIMKRCRRQTGRSLSLEKNGAMMQSSTVRYTKGLRQYMETLLFLKKRLCVSARSPVSFTVIKHKKQETPFEHAPLRPSFRPSSRRRPRPHRRAFPGPVGPSPAGRTLRAQHAPASRCSATPGAAGHGFSTDTVLGAESTFRLIHRRAALTTAHI